MGERPAADLRLAHNVSLMTVQAGAARLLVEDDPPKAQEAISAVEKAGRRALDELRHLLGVLRPDTPSDELVPQPALNQVQRLVDQLRLTGMDINQEARVSETIPGFFISAATWLRCLSQSISRRRRYLPHAFMNPGHEQA